MILTLALPAIEKMINHALTTDPDARAKIASIQNQLIEINCTDWKIKFYIVCTDHELQFEKKISRAANTTITGTLNNFLLIFIKGADTKTLFTYPIDIDGNTHNIEVLRDAFKNLDMDLEEKLSHFIGDALAHQICFRAKEAQKTLKNTNEKLMYQTKEYIYFEAKHFPTRGQVEKFYTDSAKLRDDVERLEAKMSLGIESAL